MSETAAVPLEPGRRFGDFDLIRRLGAGGGGEVWEARERRADRVVALKVLTHLRAESAEARARFEREARLAAGFRHPRVVYVLGAHDIEGLPCISMELMRGGTLTDLLQAGPPPLGEAIRLVLELLEGLEAAHDAGVLHRDVKPSNCFLEERGRGAKLGDFGVSKVLEEASDLSRTGAFLGTFHYASPEQLRGETLDERSDLYSLGATLYELVAGQRPFEGSPMAVAARILTDSPAPPSAANPDVPKGLDQVVLRLLDKDPDRRYADCAEVRRALEPYRPRTGSSAPAGVVRRLAAYLLDFVPAGLIIVAFALFVPALTPLVEADRGGWALASGLVFEGILFAYFWASEYRWGRTLGKWIAGIRVEDRSGGRIGLAQAAVRAGTLGAVWIALGVLEYVAAGSIPPVPWVWTLLGAALVGATMRPANGWAALHDVVSGSRVVREARRGADEGVAGVPARPLRYAPPAPSTPRALGPYEVQGEVWQTQRGGLLVGWDGRLHRTVWIRTYAHAADAPDLERLKESHPGRLPWLDGARGAVAWDAFGAPAGSGLVDWVEARGPLSWHESRDLLAGLASALTAEPGAENEPVDLSRVWVEGPERVVLLDFPTMPSEASPEPAGGHWIEAAARYALEGGVRAATEPYDGPDRPIPPRARRFLAGLGGPLPASRLEAVAIALEGLRVPRLGPGRRRTLVTMGAAAPVLFGVGLTAAVSVDFAGWIADPLPGYLAGFADADLDHLRALDSGSTGSRGDRLRLARLTELRGRIGDGPELPETLDHALGFDFDGVDDPEWLDFRAGLDSLVAARVPVGEVVERPWQGWGRTLAVLIGGWALLPLVVVVGASGLVAAALALVLKGGPILRGAEIVVLLERNGRAAGRLRCGLRTLVAWSPWIVGPLGGRFLLTRALTIPDRWGFPVGVEAPAALVVATILTALVWLAALRLTLRSPARGPAERLTGTVLVSG